MFKSSRPTPSCGRCPGLLYSPAPQVSDAVLIISLHMTQLYGVSGSTLTTFVPFPPPDVFPFASEHSFQRKTGVQYEIYSSDIIILLIHFYSALIVL